MEVIDDTIRKYNDAEYFASIIGYTGKISTEEYESLSADNGNYTLNDVVGKAGIEQVMDASLQGTKGYEKLYVDYLGKAVEVLNVRSLLPEMMFICRSIRTYRLLHMIC